MTRIVDDCAAIALAGLADDIATHFADDPLGTLRHDLNLTVRAVGHLDDSRADGGVCDGVSYLSDGVILYRTTGNRRENFTLAHELGHWLVDQADDVYDRLADLDDAAKLLESVCDQIARLLLLPDSRLASVVPSTVVEAKHVTDLYDATNASIHACVIALKDRLPNMGAVLVIRHREDEVGSAAWIGDI
ncbi:ImmA/IrrE family metallo-endopeptidase [Nocardioides coralli]|uniref:ImmA/IrrE family metallo-endopeptidase n=1 Tax=Nocardioides coralli TaxID=2872154 RepID=UPI001CA393F2|nr:ImmA/IrrE family metallo-endopeptidase [Nocardioides coralli]QZY27787.1 ImmA/IrrE family metallo-endopeptidase [Nocardioides coralli]